MDKMMEDAWGYATGVLEGEIPACEYIKKSCALALSLQSRDDIYFDEDAALRPIKFAGFIKHLKGPLAGKPIEFAPWQKFLISQIYGWKTLNGNRLRRSVYIEVPRKSGKSTLCSVLSLYHLMADGEVSAEVYSAAISRDMARIVFGDAQAMARASAELSKHLVIHRSNIFFRKNNSKFEPLSADANQLEGRSPSFAVVDELHVHKTSAVWDVLNVASGGRLSPILFSISTAGVNREGVCYQVRDYAIKILDGHVDDDTFFSMVYGIDDDDDWRAPASWIKANPNYGVSVQPDDLERLAKQAEESPSAETNFKTKRLNVWCNTSSAWLSMTAWDACNHPRPPMSHFIGKPCYIGLDLASVSDFACIAYLFEEDGYLFPYIKNYLPMDTITDKSGVMGSSYREWLDLGHITATDGSVTDLGYIKDELLKAFETYRIKECAFDPYGALQLVTELQDLNLPMVKHSQSIMAMSDPSKELEKAILNKTLAHGGDPVLRWMASNAVIWTDQNDNIKVKKQQAANKIDGIIALIMALSRFKVSGGLKPSPYEGRGIRTL